MTRLKFNESTMNLAGSKSVSGHELQNDGRKSRACRGLSCWCARYTLAGLKVIKCMRGCMLEEHTSKASPMVMAWKGAQAPLWMELGGLGQRLILQLHDHR